MVLGYYRWFLFICFRGIHTYSSSVYKNTIFNASFRLLLVPWSRALYFIYNLYVLPTYLFCISTRLLFNRLTIENLEICLKVSFFLIFINDVIKVKLLKPVNWYVSKSLLYPHLDSYAHGTWKCSVDMLKSHICHKFSSVTDFGRFLLMIPIYTNKKINSYYPKITFTIVTCHNIGANLTETWQNFCPITKLALYTTTNEMRRKQPTFYIARDPI